MLVEPPIVLVEPPIVLVEPPIVLVEPPIVPYQVFFDLLEAHFNRRPKIKQGIEYVARCRLVHAWTLSYDFCQMMTSGCLDQAKHRRFSAV